MDRDEYLQEVGQRYFAATGRILKPTQHSGSAINDCFNEKRSVDQCVSEIVLRENEGKV